jgi:hypothetical protein
MNGSGSSLPIVFVTLSAGALTDFADILGGVVDLGDVEAATTGWAAAVLAGVAGFFHVSVSRDADRRLAGAGAGVRSVVVSRLLSTLALTVLAAVGALLALRVRTAVATSPGVIGATLLFALIYAGIGVTVGALVRSEMNGSLIVVFVWIFDVFFGPATGGTGTFIRVFPMHYPTLAIRPHQTTRKARPSRHRIAVALVAATRQLRRMPTMWVLIIGLPVAFITTSIAITPDDPTPVELAENGQRSLSILSMADVHGAVMVPITIGFLASLAGLFITLDAADGDRRLSLTNYRSGEILTVRLVVIVAASLLATAVAVGVTAISFDAVSWPIFVAANILVALTYATIGVIVGPLFGRLGGLYLLLLLPFIDVGLAQNAMFDASPPTWGKYLPAHGAVRVMMDGAFTNTFDETAALVLALAWIVALGGIAATVFRRVTVTSAR